MKYKKIVKVIEPGTDVNIIKEEIRLHKGSYFVAKTNKYGILDGGVKLEEFGLEVERINNIGSSGDFWFKVIKEKKYNKTYF